MSFTPVIDIKDGLQGVPGIGIIMQGDATVAELNAADINNLETGFAWIMLDTGTLTVGDPDLAVEINDMVIWAEEGNWVKLVIEVGPPGTPGTPGEDGADGFSPFIDSENYWNDSSGNTGVPATGPQGPAGETVLIVGYFGDVATPADLPVDGILPVDFDGVGRPAAPYTMGSSSGKTEGLFYQHIDGPNSPEYGQIWVWFSEQAVWSNIGKIVGPEGPAGPQGPIGPEGPQGPPGETIRVVGYFGDVKTPAELPSTGLIPIDWDGPGRPPVEIQMEDGWGLFYQPPAGPSDPAYGEIWAFVVEQQLWYNVGRIAGPQGEPGPTGPAGPTAISADPNNYATLGSDSLIWVPQPVEGGTGGFVAGMIMMFSGATAPAGWNLCDGTNGAPDLRDKFVMAAGTTYPHGDTGGAAPVGGTSGVAGGHSHTISITAGGAHGHTGSTSTTDGSHSHNLTIEAAGAHDHTLSIDPHNLATNQGPNHSHETVGAGSTSNSPAVSTGSISSGFNDGGEGNRYTLKDGGGASAGNTSPSGGGANIAHTGTTSNAGSHTHNNSVAASAGSHGHTVTIAGAADHTHSGSGDTVVDHSHSIPAGTLPPFYALAYIMFLG